MLTNVRSLRYKRDELENIIKENAPDVVGVTETWLSEDIASSELGIPGYSVERTDRKADKHGGVMLYIRHSWSILQVSRSRGADNLWELLKCTVRTALGRALQIVVVYRSPRSTDDSWIQILLEASQCATAIIMGDFNLPTIDWENLTCVAGSPPIAHRVLDLVLEGIFTQHILQPTRITVNHPPSCLDIVLTSAAQTVDNTTLLPPIATSDHAVVRFQIPAYHLPVTERAPIPNAWKTDCSKLRNNAEAMDWDIVHLNVHEGWRVIRENLSCLYRDCVPMKKASGSIRGAPWFDRDLRRVLRRRNRLWHIFKAYSTPEKYEQYKLSRNEASKLKLA